MSRDRMRIPEFYKLSVECGPFTTAGSSTPKISAL
jgi:hypothetical protein